MPVNESNKRTMSINLDIFHNPADRDSGLWMFSDYGMLWPPLPVRKEKAAEAIKVNFLALVCQVLTVFASCTV